MGFDWKFFDRSSWAIINQDQLMLDWVANAKKIATQKFNSNDFNEKQFRCGGTWFVGQNFLKNNLSGKLNNIAFDGLAVNSILERYGKYYKGWDEAQVSICFEGYPRLNDGETSKSFAYRKNNFGAHVDGIVPIGKRKRRYAQECHTFIFGIPLVNFNEFAAPVVVWEGSHRIIGTFLARHFWDIPSLSWKNQDITEIYHQARREAFLKCKPKVIVVPVGGSYILHRLALHGIKPWGKAGRSEESARMIAYFRPLLIKPEFWLDKSI